MNNKNRFIEFLSENTRGSKTDYATLFKNIEDKYNIDLNDYFKGLPQNLNSKECPNTFSTKQSITYVDDKIAKDLGVDGDIVSEIRHYSGVMSRSDNDVYVGKDCDLSCLSDEQKTLLTQISYLDMTKEGIKKINNEGLKVSEISQYLAHPNDQFPGNIVMHEGLTKVITNAIVGKDSIVTESELLKDIQSCALGDLTITAITSDDLSGFQAMAFKDNFDNTGISFRGSDFNYVKGGISDWVFNDGIEWLTDNSKQRSQAIDFFDKNCNENGNNYVYGHSLGGNLTTHTLLVRANNIEEAFTIDGTPVSNRVVNMGDCKKILNSDKYNCNIVAGDVVGQLKSFSGYADNVNFIQNNNHLNYSLISAHLTQSATYDEEGNFVKCTKEDAIDAMGVFEKWFVKASQTVHGVVNEGLIRIDEATEKFEASKLGQWLENIKEEVSNFFNKDKEDEKDIDTKELTRDENSMSIDN